MRVLITGSSGPKVAATVARVLAGEHQVLGLDRVAAPTTTTVADITRIADWSPYLEGVDVVMHFAALHAPHRATHTRSAFTATNVEATRALLAAARASGVRRFIYASTTSVYGGAMRLTDRAAWVAEELAPIAEDIYDETKLAAEALCRKAFAAGFTTLALRFSRAFPESLREMALYRLYRGVDARDVAAAFRGALSHTPREFEVFNISGATPFLESDCVMLRRDAPAVLHERAPDFVRAFSARGWPLPASIDRVYVIAKAQRELGYTPCHDWQSVLATSPR